MHKQTDQRIGVVGYCRVSTEGQDNERQRLEIHEYCNQHNLRLDRLVEAVASTGRKQATRGIDDLRQHVATTKAATIVCSELSRFGRSVAELLALVDEFVQQHGCRLVFIKEGLSLQSGCNDLASEVMLHMFALLAQLEKRLIRERTKSALAARKAAGVRLGRPPGKSRLDSYEDEIRGLLQMGVKQKAIAQRVGCSENTLTRWLARHRGKWEEPDGSNRTDTTTRTRQR